MLHDGAEFEGEWIRVYGWLSVFAAHLELSSALLTGCAPIQNENFKLKKKKNLSSRLKHKNIMD